MKELIKIGQDERISARELYGFLADEPSHFSRWSKQNIEDNDYADEGRDYDTFAIVARGNKCRDYALSIDFAKELCMMSKCEKGKQARRYFIECERRLKAAPNTKLLQRIDKLEQRDRDHAAQLQKLERMFCGFKAMSEMRAVPKIQKKELSYEGMQAADTVLGNGVAYQIDGDVLTIKVNMVRNFGKSKSGKSVIIASTLGNVPLPGFDANIGLNIYRKVGVK